MKLLSLKAEFLLADFQKHRSNAEASPLTVWMPHWSDKLHLWRVAWIVFREFELSFEVSSLYKCQRLAKMHSAIVNFYLLRILCLLIPQNTHSTKTCCFHPQDQLNMLIHSIVLFILRTQTV